MADPEASDHPPIPISEHSRRPPAGERPRRAGAINARFRLLAHQLSGRLWQDIRSHLRDEAAVFNRVLIEHLDREETVVVPPFESLLPGADQHTLQKEEAELSTYRHMRMAVPWY
jgi:hypothetical protein